MSYKNELKLFKKVEHHSGRTYMAYCTPVELLDLSAMGAYAKPGDLSNAHESKKWGKCRPRWYYFELQKKSKLHTFLS